MATELTYRPVKARPPGWKPAGAVRDRSPFDSTHSATVELLQRELRHLGAVRAFIQVELADENRGVRQDGQLRAGAKVIHPGVILTIETRKMGTLVYACDRYRASGWRGQVDWEQNLRAIALGLEALRKVERYGIAERGQQYAGFAELGSGMPMGAGERPMSLDEAAELLSSESIESPLSGCRIAGVSDLLDPASRERYTQMAYRIAAKKHHPDAGGDPDLFRRLTQARDLLLTTL